MRPYGIPLDVFATFRQTWYKAPAPERENAARWISGPCFIWPCFSGWEASTGGVSSVIARAAGPKQSQGNQKGWIRAVYPEGSRRARNDTGETLKILEGAYRRRGCRRLRTNESGGTARLDSGGLCLKGFACDAAPLQSRYPGWGYGVMQVRSGYGRDGVHPNIVVG